jgi:ribonuclease T1
MSHARETSRALALPALLLAIAFLILSACASTTGGPAPGTGDPVLTSSVGPDFPSASSPSSVGPTVGTAAAPAASSDSAGVLDARFATAPPLDWNGPVMSVAELPPEALLTLELIAAGGPFPYDQDGSTFQNRERLLPDGPEDRYAEYTVETPGSADRGPRRLVVGDGRDVYYTDDHYDSFRFVTP